MKDRNTNNANTCSLCDDEFKGHYFTDLALPGRYCSWACLTVAKDATRTGVVLSPRRSDPRTMQLHKLPAGAGG